MTATGGCLCSALRYEVEGPLGPVTACHCAQCRRASGHVAAFTVAERKQVTVTGNVAWFASTPGVIRRGFCPVCGSQVFWDRIAAPKLGIAAGSLDQPNGLELVRLARAPHSTVLLAGSYSPMGCPLRRTGAPLEVIAAEGPTPFLSTR